MKSFEISGLGLDELTSSEMLVNGGGFDPIDWIIGNLLGKAIDAIVEGYKDGTYAEWFSSCYENNPIYAPWL